ncbi:hypothetical protein JYT16_00140 [Gemmatimonas aurantiaca]|nr:hypothetical protein [Gemmatimonas aurantiaca]
MFTLGGLFVAALLFVGVTPFDSQAQSSIESKESDKNNKRDSRPSADLTIDELERGNLRVAGFELASDTRVSLYAIGVAQRGSRRLTSYAWIIDADTREEVWVMQERDTDRFGRSGYLREIDDRIRLSAGRYEAFYYVGRSYNDGFRIGVKDMDDLGEFFEELAEALGELGEEIGEEIEEAFDDDRDWNRDDDRRREWAERLKRKYGDDNHYKFTYNSKDFGISDRELDELRFELSATGSGSLVRFDPLKELSELSVVDFTQVGDDERLRKGFTLQKETTLKIRANGEYSESGNIFVDAGWIVDANSRERVWEMDKWSTRYSGGGRKNRGVSDEITLPAGDYLVYFVTDDSHSFGEWNAAPPYDPFNYGLSLTVTDKSSLASIADYNFNEDQTVILALDKMRDDRMETQGFTLKKPTKLHIYALGEFAFRGFVDYGWIEDANTMEVVWEMTEDNTRHAGGATKNRVFDNVITLSEGDYLAHYSTDGSHSYHDWNSGKPFDPEKWGITLYGVGKNFDKSHIDLFSDLPNGKEILAELTRIGDDEYVNQRFSVDKATAVRILAIGEGSGGRMYDFGWIEEANTGKVVWKMRYRRTRHAGGADKNRMATVVVELDAGDYELFYQTDGSHSYQRFNASKPHNPTKWGVTVSVK